MIERVLIVENASLIWVCTVQALFIVLAAGTVLGVMFRERSNGYEPRHRADRYALSTWQSHGRAFRGYLTVDAPVDLDERRAAVDATASAIEERVEVWNRDLLSGPLFDLPEETDPALDRYEPSAGDRAYLKLTDGSLKRAAQQPMRPHPARVDTSELAIIELGETTGDHALAGVT